MEDQPRLQVYSAFRDLPSYRCNVTHYKSHNESLGSFGLDQKVILTIPATNGIYPYAKSYEFIPNLRESYTPSLRLGSYKI